MRGKSKGRIGVIKEINSLGRIVIPKEFRDRLKLEKSVELVITEEGVLVRNSEYELVSRQEKAGQSHSKK